jgi:hypothetical protein
MKKSIFLAVILISSVSFLKGMGGELELLPEYVSPNVISDASKSHHPTPRPTRRSRASAVLEYDIELKALSRSLLKCVIPMSELMKDISDKITSFDVGLIFDDIKTLKFLEGDIELIIEHLGKLITKLEEREREGLKLSNLQILHSLLEEHIEFYC